MEQLKRLRRGRSAAICVLLAVGVSSTAAMPAYASGPVWTISSSSSPTNFAPGDETGDDKYVLSVIDTAGGSDAGSPIEVSDTLPPGITASAVSGEDLGNGHALTCSPTPKPTCTYEGFEMASGDVLRIEVTVKVSAIVAPSVTNSVSVSGGGAATTAQAEDPTTISSNDAGFGISNFAATWSDTQAGAAVNLTAGFTFNQVASAGEMVPAADAKDVGLTLPQGFIVNPNAVPMCTYSQAASDSCPAETAVGVVFTLSGPDVGGAPRPSSSLVYNTQPELGKLGRLTVFLPGGPLTFALTLEPDDTHRMRLEAKNVSQIDPLTSITMTLWGAPVAYDGAGPDHVTTSGSPSFGGRGAIAPLRFLTSPTACGEPPESELSSDSWEQPGALLEASSPTRTFTGCNRLPFDPSLHVAADIESAGEPSGYQVNLTLAIAQGASGLESSSVENAAIALPPGAGISLSSANGMLACSEVQAALGSSAATCPDAAKVGTVEITTPLSLHPLQGAIYLATAYENPLHAPFAMYLIAKDPTSGASIRLTGQIETDPLTGQPTLRFDDMPQLPIGELRIHFFGGARALLSTPTACGTATSTAKLAPWSSNSDAEPVASFQIQSGADDTSCSEARPFNPVFLTEDKATGDANTLDSLALFVSRPEHDLEQELGTIAIEAPPALAQTFAEVSPCGEPEASQGACPAASIVGTVAATAGLNAYPVTLRGGIYLTGGYGGSPQGLSIEIPVNPGPFELGTAVIRAGVAVNPDTGELSLASGRLPTIMGGVPLQVDELLLLFDRGAFTVNPACEPLGITGTITSTENSTVQIAGNPLGSSSPPCPHSEPAPPQGGPQVGPVSPGTATVGLLSPEIATSGRGVAKVKLACRGTARCLGSVTLIGKLGSTDEKGHAKQEMLGTARFSLKAGATATVEVKLSARAKSALRIEHGYLRAVLSIRTSSPEPAQTHSVIVQLSTHKIRRHAKR